jgi:ribosome biogenesis GTPase
MKAKVYKSTGSWYSVRTETGDSGNARMKGIFKIDGMGSTNPVAVGDDVDIEWESETEKTALIRDILPRNNYVTRQSPSNRRHFHIIAANVDQCILMAGLRDPNSPQGFIDRFLLTCEAFHIPALLVLNKSDLFREKELENLDYWTEMYGTAGYRVVAASTQKGDGMKQMEEYLKDRITLVSGQSGVGKSSFINHFLPSLGLKTAEVSGWSGKGTHTTTFAEMFDLPDGGRIIDTPGLKEFGIVDISRQELSHYFPEMRERLNGCQFNNCLHINEPGCAIKNALEEGFIFKARYDSYCNILGTINESDY